VSRLAIAEPAFLAPWRQAPALGGLNALEAGFSVVFLFLFSQGLIGPLFADPANPDSSVVLRLMWLPIYAATVILILARPGRFLRTLNANWLLLGLAGLTLASVIWSVAPDVTLRRGFALMMTTVFGFWFASRWSWREMILITATTFGLLAVASTGMALAMPALGVDHEVHAGAWKGVWWEKNTLGAMMAWGAVSGWAALRVDPRRGLIWIGVALLCSALVVLSTSKTALLALLLGTGAVIGIALCRRGFGFAAMMLFLLLTSLSAFGLIMLIAPVEALEALGRDATLTGRTDIWAVLIGQIQNAPWTGYGYMAYWAADSGPVFWVRQATDWDVPTAHNGWIETALAIGIPGMLLMAFVYLQAMVRAIGRLFSGGETYWALVFLTLLGLVSISESNLLQQNSLSWVLFVATAAKLADRRARIGD
jgi:exopolysaccharide production protein ExoQ